MIKQEVQISLTFEVDASLSKGDISKFIYSVIRAGMHPYWSDEDFTFIKIGDIKEESEIYNLK